MKTLSQIQQKGLCKKPLSVHADCGLKTVSVKGFASPKGTLDRHVFQPEKPAIRNRKGGESEILSNCRVISLLLKS